MAARWSIMDWVRRRPWKWIGRDPADIILHRFRLLVIGRWLSVEVHEFVGSDWPYCYHSHPCWHLRIILSGQYFDIDQSGATGLWAPGMIGLVWPTRVHRIVLLSRRCTTLWISGPTVAPIWLPGKGWARLGIEPGSKSNVS